MTTQPSRPILFLVLSLLSHGALVGLLWRIERKGEISTPLKTEIQLTAQTALPAPVLPAGQLRSRSLKPRKGTGAYKSLSEKLIEEVRVRPNGQAAGAPGASTSAWGSHSGSRENWENILFYKTIYEKIESGLFYPKAFARHRIEGHIQARLTFDPVAGCLWKKATISEGNPHLRVFVLDLLRRACNDETVHRLRPLRVTTADMSFEFAIGEPSAKRDHEDETRKHGPRMIGNVLLFQAHSVKSALTWELGPFTGTFPLPFIYVNFPWLQENWDKIVNGKSTELPAVK